MVGKVSQGRNRVLFRTGEEPSKAKNPHNLPFFSVMSLSPVPGLDLLALEGGTMALAAPVARRAGKDGFACGPGGTPTTKGR